MHVTSLAQKTYMYNTAQKNYNINIYAFIALHNKIDFLVDKHACAHGGAALTLLRTLHVTCRWHHTHSRCHQSPQSFNHCSAGVQGGNSKCPTPSTQAYNKQPNRLVPDMCITNKGYITTTIKTMVKNSGGKGT